MVFPPVTRPSDGPSTDRAPLTLSSDAAADAAARGRSDAFARLEACLLEVRALEDSRRPALDRRWAVRYRALNAARDAELAVYWRRQIEMATLHAALAIAVLVAGTIPEAPPAALVAGSLLGLGIAVAWTLATRQAGKRLAQWDARLAALDASEDEEPAATFATAPDRGPAPAAGGGLLSAIFVVFWAVAAAGWMLAPDAVRAPGAIDGAAAPGPPAAPRR
jgi:hypothetical protein